MKLKNKYLLLSITPLFLVATNACASGYVKTVSSDCDFCYKNKQSISTTINDLKNQNDLSVSYKKFDEVILEDETDIPKVKKNLIENIYQTVQWVLDPEKNEAPIMIQTVQWVFDPNKKELVKPKRNKANLSSYPTKKKKENQGFKFAILKNTYLKASLSNPNSDLNQDDVLKGKRTNKQQPNLLDMSGQNSNTTTQSNNKYKILDFNSETPSNIFKKILPSMQIGIEIDF